MKNLLLVIKGFFMGIANVIPGVSGGTIAIILGIYEKFIEEERKHIFRTPKPEWGVKFVSAFEEGGSNYKVSPLKIGKKVIKCISLLLSILIIDI